MKKAKIVFNPRPLDRLLLERLIELRCSLKLTKDNFIPHSEVREKLGRNFSISKPKIKEIIEFLSYSGFIEVSHIGIKLCYILEDEK